MSNTRPKANRANLTLDLLDCSFNESRGGKRRPVSLSCLKDLQNIKDKDEDRKKPVNFLLASLAIVKFKQHANAKRKDKKGSSSSIINSTRSAPTTPTSSRRGFKFSKGHVDEVFSEKEVNKRIYYSR